MMMDDVGQDLKLSHLQKKTQGVLNGDRISNPISSADTCFLSFLDGLLAVDGCHFVPKASHICGLPYHGLAVTS